MTCTKSKGIELSSLTDGSPIAWLTLEPVSDGQWRVAVYGQLFDASLRADLCDLATAMAKRPMSIGSRSATLHFHRIGDMVYVRLFSPDGADLLAASCRASEIESAMLGSRAYFG